MWWFIHLFKKKWNEILIARKNENTIIYSGVWEEMNGDDAPELSITSIGHKKSVHNY